ncbi:WD40-repeat-containing domain protein [Lyophyllum atratum]|nr:WD40-repeat-containing domain protein [Lyophyllum atratum]
MEPGSEYTWYPPQYDVSRPPWLAAKMQPATDQDFTENFVRTAKWCPDGSQFLAQCENRTFQFFDTPTIAPQNVPEPSETPTTGSATRVFPQPSPILDFTWYPTASPLDPASFCFLASVRECPVKLLDASDGRLRASYRIVDHRERQIAPHSMAFNLSAERLYCGFEDAVEVFDVVRPGEGTRLPTTLSKKSKDGLKGIISALAFVPSQGSDMYAAGSLTPTTSNIAIFSETQGAEPLMFVSGGPPAGVTQIHFNPARPHIMYAAYRRHGDIYSWDIRANVSEPIQVYKCTDPYGRTSQKLRFDIDLSGRWLGSGDQNGRVSMFDLRGTDAMDVAEDYVWENTEDVDLTLEFDAHGDAIGSVAFHPLQPILLSTSGSRNFPPAATSSSSSSSDSDSDSDFDDAEPGTESLENDRAPRGPRQRKSGLYPVTLDSSVKLWSFDGTTTVTVHEAEMQT